MTTFYRTSPAAAWQCQPTSPKQQPNYVPGSLRDAVDLGMDDRRSEAQRIAAVHAAIGEGGDANEESERSQQIHLDRAPPLVVAAQNGHAALVQELLLHGADVSAQSDEGATALIAATLRGRRDVLQLLIARFADPRQADNLRMTAEDCARQEGDDDAVQLLEKALLAWDSTRQELRLLAARQRLALASWLHPRLGFDDDDIRRSDRVRRRMVEIRTKHVATPCVAGGSPLSALLQGLGEAADVAGPRRRDVLGRAGEHAMWPSQKRTDMKALVL